EQGVEEVEAGDPEADGAAERPGLPRQLARDRDPRPDGREPEACAQPEMAEPRDPLEVWVRDEQRDRDRAEPADDRLELQHRDQVDRERDAAEPEHLRAGQDARRKLATGGPRV